jgi:hypothetical protein
MTWSSIIVPSAASGLLCTDRLSLEDSDNKGENETLNSEIAAVPAAWLQSL